MANKKSNVDIWIKQETEHKQNALENASKHFDNKDALSVNTLEAVYGQESSFGAKKQLGRRNSDGPAGHFQFTKTTAKRMGLKVTKNNDERFDMDKSSYHAAKYLKTLDNFFRKDTKLTTSIKTTKIIKSKKPNKQKKQNTDCHWVTIDDHPVCIEN